MRARLEEIYGTDIVEITFSRLGDAREETLTVDQHLKDLEMQSLRKSYLIFTRQ